MKIADIQIVPFRWKVDRYRAGTVLRARPLEEKIAAMRSFESRVVPLLRRGLIAPVIDTVMDLDAAAAAHARMASNAGFGKIILRC